MAAGPGFDQSAHFLMQAKSSHVVRSMGIALVLWASASAGAQSPAATNHDAHAAHPAAPANETQPKAEDFLSLSSDGKKVRIVIISAFNGANYGMNFNGFAKGQAKFVVPLGADIEVSFTNRSPVPHSVVVVERAQVKRLQMGDPAFEGGSSPNPVRGTTGSKGESFQFKASEAGDFAFACGFPSHAANGHWIALEVSDKVKLPSLQLGGGAVFTPTAR
jgi:plastocyanin